MHNSDAPVKPPFSAEEIRILGCLMEKQLTTPNNYPLTMNSLMLACNQKTSREPLMNLKEGDVGHITRSLIEFGWVIIQNSGRAQRVEHKMHRTLKLNQQQQAVLAVLMLRQPQTLNEIKTRTERMAEFNGVQDILSLLEAWMAGDQPLVIRLPASQGRREDRYYHTLGTDDAQALQAELSAMSEQSFDSPATAADTQTSVIDNATYEELVTRMNQLEQRVATLESLLE